jgi:hypothetical protein
MSNKRPASTQSKSEVDLRKKIVHVADRTNVTGPPQDSPVVKPKGIILLFEELKTGPYVVALEAWGAEPRCSRSVSEFFFGESLFSNLSPFGA